MTEDRRCARGGYCADSEVIDGTIFGAPIDYERDLCKPCRSVVQRAIDELPSDHSQLGEMIGKEPASASFDPVNGSRELPVPLNLSVDALQRRIVNEALSWAESVAEVIRVDWDTQQARDSRPHVVLGRACALLSGAMPALLNLPGVDHLVWVDGFRDEELGWIPEHHAFPTRDGVAGALVLLDLHHRARRVLGQTKLVNRLPSPCPRCERAALERPDGSETISCGCCGRVYTWAEYTQLCGLFALMAERMTEDADAA